MDGSAASSRRLEAVDDCEEPQSRSPHARARNETEDQRLDRNYVELLQELRVAQTGTQILFAFVLTMAFTPRFGDITPFQRGLYITTLLSAAAATALLIGPVSFHRLLFRRRQKGALVDVANRMAIAGLGLLAVAMVSAVLLVLSVTVGTTLAAVLAGLLGAWFVLLWYVVPYLHRRRC